MKSQKVRVKVLVKIYDCDGNFVDNGFVDGVEMVKGGYGWFSTLILLTCSGIRLNGFNHMIAPFTMPLLEYKPLLLEYKEDGEFYT